MSNMSDCRFRHIVTDLSDCEDTIDELFNGVTDDGQPLSDDELRAARRLVTSCINIVTLVADMAHVEVDLDGVEQSIETVLRKANSAPLEARYDARDARVLLSKVGNRSRIKLVMADGEPTTLEDVWVAGARCGLSLPSPSQPG